MATNINVFKKFVDFISNKVQVGNAVTVTQFNDLTHRAQFELMEKDFQTFLKTGQLSDFLQFFFKSIVAAVPSNGIYSIPSDFEHLIALRKYHVSIFGVGRMINVDEINATAWGFAQASQLMVPTLRFPKYNDLGKTFRFLPKNIGSIELDYIRTPTPPVWGFTVVSGRPVYNPLTSVDLEWDEFSLNNVAAMYLSLLGVNLKDMELAQFSQMYKQETNSIL